MVTERGTVSDPTRVAVLSSVLYPAKVSESTGIFLVDSVGADTYTSFVPKTPRGTQMLKVRLGNPSAKHQYEIGTQKGRILVDANSRSQAASLARRSGYEVWDVNMVA